LNLLITNSTTRVALDTHYLFEQESDGRSQSGFGQRPTLALYSDRNSNESVVRDAPFSTNTRKSMLATIWPHVEMHNFGLEVPENIHRSINSN